MISTKIFPSILSCLDVCAAIVYLVHGDIPRVAYWLAAAGITASTLFMK